jgi:uncharacterized OsmC-like protein
MGITIEHQKEVRFRARFGEHQVTIDLPESHGGQGRGMAPPQRFIAALGGCAGVYVADFCDSQGLDYQGLRLNVDWDYEDRPRRISRACAHRTARAQPDGRAGARHTRSRADLHPAKHAGTPAAAECRDCSG